MTFESSGRQHQNSTEQLAPSPNPLFIVRMSAIGDTILAARTHLLAREKGYSPFLVTQTSNASLVDCMPQLSGACLVSDSGFKFLARKTNSNALADVDEKTFFDHFHAHAKSVSSEEAHLPVLDLQATRRSQRAIVELEKRLLKKNLHFQKYTVKNLTLWRIVLVVWSFLARSQWFGRTPPQWLIQRLKPVHVPQKEVFEDVPNKLIQSAEQPASKVLSPPDHLSSAQNMRHENDQHIVLMLGSSFKLKSWPQEYFRTLIELILARSTLKVVLCGGKDDQKVAAYLEFLHTERIINLTGRTSLAETLGWIRSAAYVVTGDSFASHAADLMGTPASVLFGSTHPLLGFAPEGSHTFVHHSALSCSPCSRHGQGECRFQNLRCLTSIKPEEVFSKIEQTLSQNRQNSDSRSPVV